MNTKEYAIKRVLLAVPVVLFVSLIVFLLVRMTPGGPALSMLGPSADQESIQAAREAMGLNKPIYVQYFEYVFDIVRLDFGESYLTGQTVREAMAQRLPTTLTLAVGGLIVALLVSVPAGVISALKKDTVYDYGALTFGLLGVSIPNFWLGIVLLLTLGINLEYFPVSGYVSPWESPSEGIRYLILPSITLGTAMAAVLTRMIRSELLEEINKEYLKAMRMKGLTDVQVVKHALKNAFIPVLTVIGHQFGTLLGGAIVVEIVFSIPGVGRLLLSSIQNRDYIMIQGAVIILTVVFVLVNLVVDVTYFHLDPELEEANS